MTIDFPSEAKLIVGPTLSDRGFALDEIFDGADEGGRKLSIVYYRGNDCKLQVYESSREGETNCMVAPLSARNEFGLRRQSKWQYLTRFKERPDVPFTELMQMARQEHASYDTPLHWVRALIENDFDAARSAILAMNRPPATP